MDSKGTADIYGTQTGNYDYVSVNTINIADLHIVCNNVLPWVLDHLYVWWIHKMAWIIKVINEHIYESVKVDILHLDEAVVVPVSENDTILFIWKILKFLAYLTENVYTLAKH